jgi:hypothetical protein
MNLAHNVNRDDTVVQPKTSKYEENEKPFRKKKQGGTSGTLIKIKANRFKMEISPLKVHQYDVAIFKENNEQEIKNKEIKKLFAYNSLSSCSLDFILYCMFLF